MSINKWIALLINLILVVFTLLLSTFFYREFRKTLDDRVLLHLTSIKRLKRLQIENYLHNSWQVHVSNKEVSNSAILDTAGVDGVVVNRFVDSLKTTNITEGLYDLTAHHQNGEILLLYYQKQNDNQWNVKLKTAPEIQEILLERTGMGNSGETYLVGHDNRLRSRSRFFPKKAPFQIISTSVGVKQAFNHQMGNDIFLDYRGEMVYSAFHKLQFSYIRWVILSEIDEKEVNAPLVAMKRNLVITVLIMLMATFLFSFWLISKFSKNITNVSFLLNQIAIGNYKNLIEQEKVFSTEIKQLYHSLNTLYTSLNEAIYLANSIGEMDEQALDVSKSTSDPLLKALFLMKEKLKALRDKEEENQKHARSQLIKGQEMERSRLSKDLHDGIGPLLTSLKLKIQGSAIDKLVKDEVKKTIDQTINEVRRVSYDLMPQSLMDFGVAKSIHFWIDQLKKNTSIKIDFIHNVSNSILEQSEVNICIFRVVQELVNNSLKHSNATEITLSLTQFEDKLCLFYKDNGVGFDSKAPYTGSGLTNIKERVNVLKGYFQIESNSKTTTVEVELPLKVE